MINVFVYGSLKKGYGNNRLLQDSLFVQEDETAEKDFDLRCWGAFPAVYHVDGYTSIKGELYQVTQEVFERLDMLEGYPSFYNRKIVHLRSGELAWMYYIKGDEKEGTVCPDGVWR